MVTVVIESQHQVNKEYKEDVQVGEDGKHGALFDTFSKTSGFSEDREETIDVGVGIEDKGAS